jgi:hypothetical protein
VSNSEIVVGNMVYEVPEEKLGMIHALLSHVSEEKQPTAFVADDNLEFSSEALEVIDANGFERNSGAARIVAQYLDSDIPELIDLIPEYDENQGAYVFSEGTAKLPNIGFAKFVCVADGLSYGKLDDCWFDYKGFILLDHLHSREMNAVMEFIVAYAGIDELFEYFVDCDLSITELPELQEMWRSNVLRKWKEQCEDAHEALQKHIIRTIKTESLNTAELHQAVIAIIDARLERDEANR